MNPKNINHFPLLCDYLGITPISFKFRPEVDTIIDPLDPSPSELVHAFHELPVLNQTTVRPGKAYFGFEYATAFTDTLTESTIATLMYGGEQNLGKVHLQVQGSPAHSLLPIIRYNTNSQLSRRDTALDITGVTYDELIAYLMRILDEPDPDTHGKVSKGRTRYFGSRSSEYCLRVYEWGKCHYPKFPEYHDIIRIELENKIPNKYKARRESVIHLDNIAHFNSCKLGNTVYSALIADHGRTPIQRPEPRRPLDMQAKLFHLVHGNKTLIEYLLKELDGDLEQLGTTIFDEYAQQQKRKARTA